MISSKTDLAKISNFLSLPDVLNPLALEQIQKAPAQSLHLIVEETF